MVSRRILAYARVSSEEQAKGSSLQDQQETIRAYAASRGVAVARFYVEAESAVHEKIERREQIRALMGDVRAGDLVVCAKLDRWSRDPEFTYGSVRKILAAGASFYAVDERCDPSTSEGDTALGFRILFAREEHKRIRERMVGTRKLLRDRGLYVEGLPPWGYRRTLPKGTKGPDKNVLAIDPDAALLVRRAFAMCIQGASISKIATALGVARDLVADALRKRVYVGEITNSRGDLIRARHEAIVDAHVFARAQAALDARRLGGPKPRGTPSQTSGWILRDVAVCGHCGARMSAQYAGRSKRYPTYTRHYYRCSHKCRPGGCVAVREVEALAEPLIVARLEELKEELGREPAPGRAPKVQPDGSNRKVKLARKRERFIEAFGEGFIDRDELRERLTKIDDETRRLDADEQAAQRPSALTDPRTRRATLREVAAIRRAWTRAQPEARREIVRHLAISAGLVVDKAPAFVWRSAEQLAEPIAFAGVSGGHAA